MKITMEQFMDLEEKILGTIPHGSGIDGKWAIGIKGNKVTCNNSFHLMDENGFYAGWKDFCFTIDLETFTVKLTGGGKQAGDYIYETMEYWFSQNKGEIAKIIGIDMLDYSTGRAIDQAINAWRMPMAKMYNCPAEWPKAVQEISRQCNEISKHISAFSAPYKSGFYMEIN